MKNTKMLIIALLLLINTANAAVSTVLQATPTSTGITPGKTGIITLSLSNAGTEIAYETKIVLKSIDNPLSSNSLCNTCTDYSTSQNKCISYEDYCYTNVGDIYGSNSQDAIFKINVPENIQTGVYTVTFEIQYGAKNVTNNAVETRSQTKTVSLNIESLNNKPDVNVKTVTTPEITHPGQEFNITIELENTGNLKAQQLNIELISANFEIKGGSNKLFVGELNSNETIKINYTLLSDAKLTPSVYGIDLNMTYQDNDNIYSKKTNTGILIDGETGFNIFIQDISPDVINANTLVSALISVANTGIINAESVSIKINPSNDIQLENINQDFLGDLNTGDFTTTSFKFTPKKEGEIKINLTIEYLTPSGKKTTQDTIQTIILRFASTEAITQTPTISTLDVILTLTVIALIIYIFNKRKNKK